MDRLNTEEAKARDMLEKKMQLQTQLMAMEDDVAKSIEIYDVNRKDIIKKRVKKSELYSLEDIQKDQLEKLVKTNEKVIRHNTDLEKENEELKKKITSTIQRVDINNLLKEVDVEDLKLLAQNNKQVNATIMSLVNKWQRLERGEAE